MPKILEAALWGTHSLKQTPELALRACSGLGAVIFVADLWQVPILARSLGAQVCRGLEAVAQCTSKKHQTGYCMYPWGKHLRRSLFVKKHMCFVVLSVLRKPVGFHHKYNSSFYM